MRARKTTPYSPTPDELAAIDEALSDRRLAFTEAEVMALVELLLETITSDRYPLSPRIKMLKSILAKIEAPAQNPEPFLAPKPGRQDATTVIASG